ncbi:MAG: hypothetical protein ACM3P1_01140 [Candidatus Saccharibacteria bacterium]
MKKLTILLALVSMFNIGFANETYHKAMTESIDQLFRSATITEYVDAANQFERISQIEKSEWLPLYYASYAYIMISFQEGDNAKKDAYLDQAQKLLDKAFTIAPNESELYMLQGFLYPSRINIDPMARGMLYMEKMNTALNKALELNPDNPRVYYLRATMTYHMPQAYGGGAANALPFYKTADEKYKIFKPQTDLSPNWGRKANEAEFKKASEELKQ